MIRSSCISRCARTLQCSLSAQQRKATKTFTSPSDNFSENFPAACPIQPASLGTSTTQRFTRVCPSAACQDLSDWCQDIS